MLMFLSVYNMAHAIVSAAANACAQCTQSLKLARLVWNSLMRLACNQNDMQGYVICLHAKSTDVVKRYCPGYFTVE